MIADNASTFARTWDAVSQSWVGMLLGLGLLLVAMGAGSAMASRPEFLPVRAVKWWINKVALSVFQSRSFTARAAIIFTNNLVVLAILVAVGAWKWGGVIAIAILGMNLGIGLRVLGEQATSLFSGLGRAMNGEIQSEADRRRMRWGTALNLLEPVAIMIAMGISLHRAAVALPPGIVWSAFAVWIIPLTLAAAVGEAMWIGVLNREATRGSHADSPDHDSIDWKDAE